MHALTHTHACMHAHSTNTHPTHRARTHAPGQNQIRNPVLRTEMVYITEGHMCNQLQKLTNSSPLVLMLELRMADSKTDFSSGLRKVLLFLKLSMTHHILSLIVAKCLVIE